MQLVSRAVEVTIGINALGYGEVLGIAVGDSAAEGCCWQRCRVHLLRNQLSLVPKAGQDMVAARDDVLACLHFPQEH